MDYERIDKPSHHHHHQAGGFSPRKLREMLIGVDKRRKEEELDSRFSLRSDANDLDDRCGRASDGSKGIDTTSSPSESSTEKVNGQPTTMNLKFRSQEEDSIISESVMSFEFHKPERVVHRAAIVIPFSKPTPSKWDDAEKWISSPTSNRQVKATGAQQKKSGLIGYGHRVPAAKILLDVADELDPISRHPKKENFPGPYPVVDSGSVIASWHESPKFAQSATIFSTPPTEPKSVPLRDMGTEMTPVSSQEPSRTGTPTRATTPTRSQTSSRPSTPPRTAANSTMIESVDSGDSSQKGLSAKELKQEVRREIMALGTLMGKANIAAWASKEQEETDASSPIKTVPVGQPVKNDLEIRAVSWEEAEKSKYLARFKQEEIKIQAWENHQKAKTEAEMRKTEVEVEKRRARANDKLVNNLAAVRRRAVAKLAAAEAKRNQQALRTTQQAEHIRRTGRIPSSFPCWSWCS